MMMEDHDVDETAMDTMMAAAMATAMVAAMAVMCATAIGSTKIATAMVIE